MAAQVASGEDWVCVIWVQCPPLEILQLRRARILVDDGNSEVWLYNRRISSVSDRVSGRKWVATCMNLYGFYVFC
ncbi:hypothetical protein CASFOL_029232 [Castilleja foliolosa]|uniref:Uncharacterized protein n=1 Tax=Castilleja foliolosa TaxID=1961234 RepID=A0ABD3CCY9_9LAMI